MTIILLFGSLTVLHLFQNCKSGLGGDISRNYVNPKKLVSIEIFDPN